MLAKKVALMSDGGQLLTRTTVWRNLMRSLDEPDQDIRAVRNSGIALEFVQDDAIEIGRLEATEGPL
ncbi:hypothetical protein ACFFWD_31730 [Bradyrhizobium erythrophlei]|uniref:hypothetical protein n=1 Tax=Bradyrhizobium erythrophlei TaxID=1437360 RepID=UPI0035E52C29